MEELYELALKRLKLNFPDVHERMGRFYIDEDGEIRTWESWCRAFAKDPGTTTLLDMKSLREIDLNPDGPKAA